MAMTPTQIATTARTAEPGTPVGRRLASNGRKLPWFLSAARKPADRDYTPRYDLG
jgi:hypothetical protein